MLKKILASVFSIFFVVNMCGCIALLAGAAGAGGTAVWLKGKLVQEVNAPFQKSIDASKSALESLNLDITKETKKDDVAQIISKYTDGKTIWIDIHMLSDSKSRVEVRVGAISDEETARKILNNIVKYL